LTNNAYARINSTLIVSIQDLTTERAELVAVIVETPALDAKAGLVVYPEQSAGSARVVRRGIAVNPLAGIVTTYVVSRLGLTWLGAGHCLLAVEALTLDAEAVLLIDVK
jgi:hypothetical protein